MTHFKYLGVTLDCHLTFTQHIRNICSKVSQHTGLLWRIRSLISQPLAKQLYVSLIEPYFLYLDYVYDGCNKTLSDKLQKSQNNSLQAVLWADPRYLTAALHTETNIDWLDNMRARSTCLQVYKCINNYNPPALNKLFTMRVTNRNLRNANDIILDCPLTKTQLGERNIKVRGVKYWSKLGEPIRYSNTVSQFKRNLKLICIDHLWHWRSFTHWHHLLPWINLDIHLISDSPYSPFEEQ